MRYILIIIILVQASSKQIFENIECDQNVDIMPDRIRLTSKRTNVMENKCIWKQQNIPFPNTFYIQVDRKYALKRSNRADSVLSIQLENNKHDKISLDIHNDKIVSGDDRCLGLFVSPKSRPFWIRVQVDALLDLKLTFISVSYATFKSSEFINCLHIERTENWSSAYLSFQANTHSGMTQDIQGFSLFTPFMRPVVNDKLEKRILTLETRIQNIEKQISNNYKQNTIKHKIMSERHNEFANKVEHDTSHVHSKLTNRVLLLVASGAIVFIFVFWYMSSCIRHVTIIKKDHVI